VLESASIIDYEKIKQLQTKKLLSSGFVKMDKKAPNKILEKHGRNLLTRNNWKFN
jgi:hypothetical protein